MKGVNEGGDRLWVGGYLDFKGELDRGNVGGWMGEQVDVKLGRWVENEWVGG